MKNLASVDANENFFVHSSSTNVGYANICRDCISLNGRYIARGNLDDNAHLLVEEVR